MFKVSVFITIFKIVLTIIASIYLVKFEHIQLSSSELVISLVALFACLGGVFSARKQQYSYRKLVMNMSYNKANRLGRQKASLVPHYAFYRR